MLFLPVAATVLSFPPASLPGAARGVYHGVPPYRTEGWWLDDAERDLKPERRFYLGVGGAYSLRHGRGDEMVLMAADYWGEQFYRYRVRPRSDDGFGLNLKLGYLFRNWFALEARFDRRFKYGFDGKDSFWWTYANSFDLVEGRVEGDAELFDLTLSGKLILPAGRIKPFALAGLGFMRGKKRWEGVSTVSTYDPFGERWRGIIRRRDSVSISGAAVRLGIGAEYYLTRGLGIDAEISYISGLGEVSEVEHLAFGMGVLVAF